jgi:anti-sigma factor RsiW
VTCHEARDELSAYQHGWLSADRADDVRGHLTSCPACARVDAGERALTDALERRLPQHAASLALKRRLAAAWPADGPAEHAPARRSWWRLEGAPAWWSRWGLAPAAALAAVLLVSFPAYQQWAGVGRNTAAPGLVGEAVNDHLRVLLGRPLGVASGGIHEVRPWFAGRLDFAPVIRFEGDAEFPLKGGAVEYFLDRQAAVVVYGRRLHTISLFVFRAEGLSWPRAGLAALGGTQAYRTTGRGFNVVLWRDGELGYALVSDVDATELWRLAGKLAGG